jgi:hypothetical protein
LRTILVLLTAAAMCCGVAARHTDPMLVRKGMSRAGVWWNCGSPVSSLTLGREGFEEWEEWGYAAELEGTDANYLGVDFIRGRVYRAMLIKADGSLCPPTYDDVADND